MGKKQFIYTEVHTEDGSRERLAKFVQGGYTKNPYYTLIMRQYVVFIIARNWNKPGSHSR